MEKNASSFFYYYYYHYYYPVGGHRPEEVSLPLTCQKNCELFSCSLPLCGGIGLEELHGAAAGCDVGALNVCGSVVNSL